jgi:hypothetical protein
MKWSLLAPLLINQSNRNIVARWCVNSANEHPRLAFGANLRPVHGPGVLVEFDLTR